MSNIFFLYSVDWESIGSPSNAILIGLLICVRLLNDTSKFAAFAPLNTLTILLKVSLST